MDVTIQLADGGVARVEPVMRELGLKIAPLHPTSRSPNLSRYYRVQVRDKAEADRLIRTMLDLPFVTAAFLKPLAALP